MRRRRRGSIRRGFIRRVAGAVSRRVESEKGATLVMTAILLIPLLAVAALAIDLGNAYWSQAELQAAADSAVLAATAELPDMDAAQAQALSYAQANTGGADSAVGPGDVLIGFWDADTRTFYPNQLPLNAVRVTASRTEGHGNAVPTYFASVIGIDALDITAQATAARDVVADVVIVQDITVSFEEEIGSAIQADKAMVDTFADQYAEGVRVAVVTFARDTYLDKDLTWLSTGQGAVNAAINGIETCSSAGSRGGPCYGTDQGAGIDRARVLLQSYGREDVQHVIVLVTDGVPCILESGDPVGRGQEYATAAANRADAAGIDIFSVSLYEYSGSSHPCLSSDVSFNESLARGIGWGISTPNPSELSAILRSIVDEMPIRLVD